MDHNEIIKNALVLCLSGLVDPNGEVLCDFIQDVELTIKFLNLTNHYIMNFYLNNIKTHSIEFKFGQRIGLKRYYKNGLCKSDESFINNLREGKYIEYYNNGNLESESFFCWW